MRPPDGRTADRVFDPTSRASMLYDKDFVGNKRVEVCGVLLGQQVRNAIFRMRGFVERNVAKTMTCLLWSWPC